MLPKRYIYNKLLKRVRDRYENDHKGDFKEDSEIRFQISSFGDHFSF